MCFNEDNDSVLHHVELSTALQLMLTFGLTFMTSALQSVYCLFFDI